MNFDPLIASRKEFRRAHNQVTIKDLLAQLRGQPTHLLPFEEVLQKLRLSSPAYRGLQEVPLDQIIGSFFRYNDFTRTFLPRRAEMQERWAAIDRLAVTRDLPPVELYKVGDAYFIADGHHRVSVARRAGWRTIMAHVREYHTRVPLEPETALGDLLIKKEYLEFLEHTRLDESRPGHYIEFTSLGCYRELECQIASYQAALSQIDGRPFSYEEAAAYWYDMIYTPILQIICQKEMLRDFPGRTEADLFVWVVSHQRELSEAYDYEVPLAEATDGVINQRGVRWPRRFLLGLKERLLGRSRERRSSCDV